MDRTKLAKLGLPSTHSPLQVCIDLVTEAHDELPVFILVPGVGGLLCRTKKDGGPLLPGILQAAGPRLT